jgi:hypothetical protein
MLWARHNKGEPMTEDTRDKEFELAWQLWNLLTDLSQLIWNRHESDFVDRIISEEEELERMKRENERLPF